MALNHPYDQRACHGTAATGYNTMYVVFCPPFSSRVWPHAQVLLTGAILAPSKRTVSAFLRVMGLDHRSDFQTYHWVLNRCVWSPLKDSRLLLQVLLATFTPRGAPCWSVNTDRLVPFLPQSTGKVPVFSPPNDALVITPSSACHFQAISTSLS